jgi:hypothetical protein
MKIVVSDRASNQAPTFGSSWSVVLPVLAPGFLFGPVAKSGLHPTQAGGRKKIFKAKTKTLTNNNVGNST